MQESPEKGARQIEALSDTPSPPTAIGLTSDATEASRQNCEISDCYRSASSIVVHPQRGEMAVCENHTEIIVEEIDGEVIDEQ